MTAENDSRLNEVAWSVKHITTSNNLTTLLLGFSNGLHAKPVGNHEQGKNETKGGDEEQEGGCKVGVAIVDQW